VSSINKNQDRKNESLVNEDITAEIVLVVSNDGQMLGEMSPAEGIKLAEEKGLDLVCVAPNAPKPVCRMMDYSKFRYEQQKRARVAKKNQTVISVKEVWLTPVISSNDFDTKLKAGLKFLQQGNKLKVTLRFNKRARMLNMGNPDIQVLTKYIEATQEFATVENKPTLEGKSVSMILVAKKEKNKIGE
jgi:translation initiation factor IF-3